MTRKNIRQQNAERRLSHARWAKDSAWHGWWAFCRGIGYGLARIVMRGVGR